MLALLVHGAHAQGGTSTYITAVFPSELPPDTLQKYESSLGAALRKAKLGEVRGSGRMVTSRNTDARSTLEIALYDLKRGLPFLSTRLRDLKVPYGTSLNYTDRGVQINQVVH